VRADLAVLVCVSVFVLSLRVSLVMVSVGLGGPERLAGHDMIVREEFLDQMWTGLKIVLNPLKIKMF
jgi:hypothetical protein